MRIVIASQVFPPEIHPTAVMVNELAEYLGSLGHRVYVVTGYPHHGMKGIFPGFSRKAWTKEKHGAIDVLRTWHIISSKKTIFSRSAVFTSQALGSAIAVALQKSPDLVIDFGPPLFGPCFLALVSYYHHAKLVNVIHDIHPDVAIEMGHVRSSLVIKAARAVEKFQYRNSDLTIVLTEGFRRTLLERGVPPERIAVLPVWLDPQEVRPLPRENSWRAEQGLNPEQIVVLYAGTIGWVSGAEMVVDAARELQTRREIVFLFVGDGAVKDEIQTRSRKAGLNNMRFLPFQPRERLPEVQASSDISLVTLAPGRGRTSVPSKVQGYMAAGRPIIAAVDADSDTGLEIASSRCGLVVTPGDPAALASAIRYLADSPAHRNELGANGRRRLEEYFAKNVVLERFGRLLESLIRA